MKVLQFLTLTILFAITITSCSKEATIEEKLEGNWELTEATVTGEITESLTSQTISFEGENNGSTLEIKILDDQTSVLSGILNITTSATMNGLELMSFDTEENYNESRAWKITEEGLLELEGTEDFGLGKLEDDQLIFSLNEILLDAEEDNPFFSEDDKMTAELVFVKK